MGAVRISLWFHTFSASSSPCQSCEVRKDVFDLSLPNTMRTYCLPLAETRSHQASYCVISDCFTCGYLADTSTICPGSLGMSYNSSLFGSPSRVGLTSRQRWVITAVSFHL